MKQYLLLTSALVASGLLSNGGAEAACIQTPTCSSLGYESTTSCTGGLKCPFGNAWNCTLINKITELEKTIEKNQQEEALANCKIGDILYSDMSCNANMIASKTPIGVVFDTTNHLAVGKDVFKNMPWSYVWEDIPGIKNYENGTSAAADWYGFNNTKALYEADKSGENYPAVKAVLTYSTEGTEQGQWYLPSAGEQNVLHENYAEVAKAVRLIGGTEAGDLWTSSETSDYQAIEMFNDLKIKQKYEHGSFNPIINYASKQKIDFVFENGKETECKIGDILYSDKKCYFGGLAAGKTPIAIVFDIDKRLAVALENSPDLSWATYEFDIPILKNYENDIDAENDFKGKENTKTIVNYCKANSKSCPAAEYANNYTTEGTKAGDWYLPALGELKVIADRLYNKDINGTINVNLERLGKEEVDTYFCGLWSSTEINSYAAGALYNDNDGFYNSKAKNYSYYHVRPVLAF